jgi:hypothetical protein
MLLLTMLKKISKGKVNLASTLKIQIFILILIKNPHTIDNHKSFKKIKINQI